MRIWITLCLLIAASLAGCAGEDATRGTDTTTGTDDATETSSSTSASSTSSTTSATTNTDGPSTNTAPTADLTADVVNGTAPLNVTFTVDGSDADGDNLTWSLEVNGTDAAEGQELPATILYNFTTPGNFSVTLTVSDGINETSTSLGVSVEAAASVGFTPWSFYGTAAAQCTGCVPASLGAPAPFSCVGLANDMNEMDCVFAELPGGAEGRLATIIGDGLDGTWAEYAFLSACDPTADILALGGDYDGIEVVVPAGATCIAMFDGVLPGTTLSISIN